MKLRDFLSPIDEEGVRLYQGLFFLAILLYPAWWLVIRYTVSVYDDPLMERCAVALIFILLFILTYLNESCRRYIYFFFHLGGSILTYHFFGLVMRNFIGTPYAIGSFVVVFSIAASCTSRLGLILYAGYVLSLAIKTGLSIRNEQSLTFVIGLATAFLVTYYAISGRLKLIKSERLTNEKLQDMINSFRKSEEDLRISNEDLRKTQRQLSQAQKMEVVGQLASGIAHDFNNILAAIMIQSGLIKERVTENEMIAELEVIERSAERGADLTKKLLGFAKKNPHEYKVLNIHDTIQELMSLIVRTFPEKIKTYTILAQDLLVVEGDSSQILQVFLNLAVNARDAMPEGGTLTIGAEKFKLASAADYPHLDLAPGTYVKITFSDTGTGMSSEVQNKIFEPFFTTKEVGKGTGLGLAMSLGIIKAHSGEIIVDSKVGKGTVFSIYLPSSHTKLERRGSSVTQKQNELRKRKFSGLSFLVVDDDPVVCNSIAELMRNEGAEVHTAHNGSEALQLFQEFCNKIQVAVMDVRIPHTSATHLLKGLRRLKSGVSIVFVSGYAESEEIRKLRENERVGFLEKPFKPAQLIQELEKYLGHNGPRG